MMAWITIMVVAFIIATACVISEVLKYKERTRKQIQLDDETKKFIEDEVKRTFIKCYKQKNIQYETNS